MNTGIQDAYNLAWKLAYVLNGKASFSILKTYSDERMENAKHLLRTTDRLFDLLAGATWFMNFIRLKILPLIAQFIFKTKGITMRVFPFISQIGITYINSSLTIKSKVGKVKAGVRMPYFTFDDGRNVFDYLKEASFKALFFGEDFKLAFERLNELQIDFVKHSFTEIPTAVFKDENNFLILLRPDNHILYIGKDVNNCIPMLNNYFKPTT